MKIEEFGQSFKISTRVYIGFLTALIAAVIIALVGISGLKSARENFDDFKTLNKRVTVILELDQGVTSLQRNVLAYTYTGHQGVANSVEENVLRLKNKFKAATKLMETPEEIELMSRMKRHFENYSQTFKLVLKERVIREGLVNKQIPLNLRTLNSLGPTNQTIQVMNYTEKLLFQYLEDPDYSLITNALKQLAKHQTKNSILGEALATYRSNILRVSQATRSYLYLVSVVMAGEAQEFAYVSGTLRDKILSKVEPISEHIENSVVSSQRISIISSIILVLMGLCFSWVIIRGIAEPIRAITNTFNSLARGKSIDEIPGANRGDEIGVLSQAADVFRQKNFELEEYKDKLEQSNEELSQFAYRTSHDLKAPLFSILGLTDLISEDLKDKDYEEVRKNIDKITILAKRLETLIADIINLTRIDYVGEEKEEIDLVQELKEVEEKLSGLIKENHVDIVLNVDSDKMILIQKTFLRQVLENLISNSVKYCDKNKPERFVEIKVLQNAAGTEIMVRDNGIGIDSKFHSELFGMFKRFHSDITFGTGLGLYLVRKHLEKMNGRVEFESQVGQGTTFFIKF